MSGESTERPRRAAPPAALSVSSVRDLPEYVEVGGVRRPHGVRGELLVEAWTDVDGRFERGSRLLVRTAAGTRRPVRITAVRPHAAALLVRLEEHDDRDAVEPLRGAVFEVPRAETPAPGDGTFYYFELAGCACRDRCAGSLGRVRDVLEDGGGLLLEVEDRGRRLLIPFVEAYIDRIDVGAGSIDLDLPAGLVETCTSTS